MTESSIVSYKADGEEIQRVQTVRFDSWSELDFFTPEYDRAAFDKIYALYSTFTVPKYPWAFGQMVMFHVPDDMEFPFSPHTKYGELADRQIIAAAVMQSGVKLVRGKPVFLSGAAKKLWSELEKRNYVRVVCGKLPHTKILPISSNFGFLSECEKTAKLKANCSFFTMDAFDRASVYDKLGNPIGLRVKDGVVLAPPQFKREALTVRGGKVSVEIPSVEMLTVVINGKAYRHGENAVFYERPARRKTPLAKGVDLVIIGRSVTAVHSGGGTQIPASGFVLHTDGAEIKARDAVEYRGMEDVQFGLQVGNSIAVNGRVTDKLISPFYNIYNPWKTVYPPSLYPLDFKGARAPRTALGADKDGRPMLIWVEGAGKFGHASGEEGCGASLSELGEICEKLGMHNGVNLDGGGSSQILINNARSLRISDRDNRTFEEKERAVPMGLIIR